MNIQTQTQTISPQHAVNNSTGSEKNDAKLLKATKDFEAIMIKQLLTTMRKSVPKDGLFNSGFAEESYQDMYDEQIAKEMANGRGIGIAKAMYKQLSQEQENSTTTKP